MCVHIYMYACMYVYVGCVFLHKSRNKCEEFTSTFGSSVLLKTFSGGNCHRVYTCHYYHLMWQMYNHSGCDRERKQNIWCYKLWTHEGRCAPLWHFSPLFQIYRRHLFIAMVLIATLGCEWNTHSNRWEKIAIWTNKINK